MVESSMAVLLRDVRASGTRPGRERPVRPFATGPGGRSGSEGRSPPGRQSLDLADEVERRGQRRSAFVPLGRADLARVLGDVLRGLQLAQRLLHVTRNRVVVD